MLPRVLPRVLLLLMLLMLLLLHGWPSSFVEFLGAIGPLTKAGFDLVIPSLPGFGFSAKPATTGWGVDRIAGAWAQLMARLGYSRYAAQGGDWGSAVTSAIGALDAAQLLDRKWERVLGEVGGSTAAVAGVVASLENPTANTGDAQGDTFQDIENLEGSEFDDLLVGQGEGTGWRLPLSDLRALPCSFAPVQPAALPGGGGGGFRPHRRHPTA